jgi:hypothetical protein
VEDRWRFGGGSGDTSFFQIVNYQDNTKKLHPSGGGWRYKTKKIVEEGTGNFFGHKMCGSSVEANGFASTRFKYLLIREIQSYF